MRSVQLSKRLSLLLWGLFCALSFLGAPPALLAQELPAAQPYLLAQSAPQVPAYSGKPYAVLNKNVPRFTKSQLTTKSYEKYSPLDSLGRCGPAQANLGLDLMPTGKRKSISKIKPSGWQAIKYDCVPGKYLYNRCHLIGYQLSAENANRRNLITGTRYLNVDGMLPFENMVADYIKETGNHVLYRVTPVFKGKNLVANGVILEAMSVEDKGAGILFNVYCYNVQPQIKINYANGQSSWSGGAGYTGSKAKKKSKPKFPTYDRSTAGVSFVLNTNSHKFHRPTCRYAKKISPRNYATSNQSSSALINQGYSPCKVCL